MFINLIDFLFNFYYLFDCKVSITRLYLYLNNYIVFFFYIKLLFFNFNNIFIVKFFFIFDLIESNYIYFNKSITYGIKFSVSILFLIFIRAGIPRYRYDYLTILG